YDLAQKHFNVNLDKNDRIVFEDARAFLRHSQDQYDLIFLNLYSGSFIPCHTHTKEALDLMRDRLKPNGLLVSNIVGHPDDLYIRSLIKTLKASFPVVVPAGKYRGFDNMMGLAALDQQNIPPLTGMFQEMKVDDSTGELILDDKNPVELLMVERLDDLHRITKQVLGYTPFFAM
ncbi:MAG: fused MFS/spermidine synthase, partial [Gammaproteobacteria bacterium]|nr:fused MFS/spermidine synthase [Gammaproteobacteria bacterium]